MDEFVPFRFHVNLYREGQSKEICEAFFSEVSGLEITMEPKVIAVGGQNCGEIQRVGLIRYSPIVLKRGVTKDTGLWKWFDDTTRGSEYGMRVQGEIKVLGVDKVEPILTWKLNNVLPTRFKGSDLSSTSSQIAIEELTLVHEGLTMASSHLSNE